MYARVTGAPVVAFMREFRDFLQHDGPALTIATLTFKGGQPRASIEVSTTALRRARDHRWPKAAMDYLNSLGDTCRVDDVAKEYRDRVDGLWIEFVHWVNLIDRAQLAEAERLRSELAPLLANQMSSQAPVSEEHPLCPVPGCRWALEPDGTDGAWVCPTGPSAHGRFRRREDGGLEKA
jgi:hypothetical protein